MREKIIFLYRLLFLGLCLFFFSLLTSKVEASSLYLSPSFKKIVKGDTLNVGIYVSSPDQSINAVSGKINFSIDSLEIISLSKTNSVINFWVQEPSFSNINGNINFEGIILNPGFIGGEGKILEVVLRAKNIGLANLTFLSGSILANDGQGTNVLKDMKSARIEISEPKFSTPLSLNEQISSENLPPMPVVVSSTHSDSNQWYSNNDPEFSWNLPSDVIAVRLLYDRYSNSQPNVIYSPPISSKKLENLNDGIWYFHVQFKNNNGWGAINHFRFQIDSTPPQPFEVKVIKDYEFDSRPKLFFSAKDDLSGILKYRIKIGDNDFIEISKESIENSGFYQISPQIPGKHLILVQAFDKAGNSQTSLTEVEIKPLNSPLFTNYPKVVRKGESVIIEGNTYPKSTVNLWIEKKGMSPVMYTSLSDESGIFKVVINDIEVGDYQFWADVVRNEEARSFPTSKLSFSVTEKDIIKIGSFLINALAIIVSLLAIIFFLVFVSTYFWKKFIKLRASIKEEVKEVEKDIHRTLIVLYKNVESYIRLLENVKSQRKLTFEEERILEKLRRDFEYAEKAIRSEVEKIDDLSK